MHMVGERSIHSGVLFGDVWTEYKRALRARGLADSTVKITAYELHSLIADDEHVAVLTTARLEARLEARRDAGHSQWTLRKVYSAASSFGKWAVARGYLAQSPTEGLDAPKRAKHLRRPASYAEVEAILQAATRSRYPARDVALVLMLARTGLRNGELCALDRVGVDVEGRWLYVGEHGTAKSGEGRKVRFDEVTQAALQRYLKTRAPADHEALFLSQRGLGRITPSGVKQILKRLCAVGGIAQIVPHQLRHHFGMSWVDTGHGNDLALMTLMGHGDLRMTAHYAKHSEHGLAAHYDKVFGAPEPEPHSDATAVAAVAEVEAHTPGYDELREAICQTPNLLALARLYEVEEYQVRRWVVRLGLLPFYDKRRVEVLTKQAHDTEATIEIAQFMTDIVQCPNWAELGRRYGLKAESVRDWAKRRNLLPIYYAAKAAQRGR